MWYGKTITYIFDHSILGINNFISCQIISLQLPISFVFPLNFPVAMMVKNPVLPIQQKEIRMETLVGGLKIMDLDVGLMITPQQLLQQLLLLRRQQ